MSFRSILAQQMTAFHMKVLPTDCTFENSINFYQLLIYKYPKLTVADALDAVAPSTALFDLDPMPRDSL